MERHPRHSDPCRTEEGWRQHPRRSHRWRDGPRLRSRGRTVDRTTVRDWGEGERL